MNGKLYKTLESFGKYLEEFIAVIAAAVVIYLGYTDVISEEKVLYSLLGILGFVSLEMIRIKNSISNFKEQLSRVLADLRSSTLGQSLDSLFIGDGIDNDHNKELIELALVEESQEELLFLQETGSRIIEKAKKAIAAKLTRGVPIRIVICANEANTDALLMLRNANLNNPQAFKTRHEGFKAQIESICTVNDELDYGRTTNVSIRFTPYPIDITCVISDPSNIERGHCVVRHAGFRVPYDSKLDMNILKRHSKKVFEYYYNQYNLYGFHAFKKIIVTGKPGVGKTTIFKKVFGNNVKGIFSIICEEIKDAVDGRVGFQVDYTGNNAGPIRFATKRAGANVGELTGIDKYEVNSNIWDTLAVELLSHKNEIIVIDEVGLMQVQNSASFLSTVETLISDTNVTLYATAPLDCRLSQGIEGIKRSMFVNCIEVSEENRNNVECILQDELRASLRVVDYVNCRSG